MTVEDVTFTRAPARRPQPRIADPLLQWATGLPTKDKRIYAGWFVEAGKLDDLDAAMTEAGYSQVTIRHGGGNLVTHWAVETANVFIIADGLHGRGEAERYGIAFGWRTRENGRGQSQMRARVFLRDLLAVGYTEPLIMTVKGTLTDDLTAALMRQYDVLEACTREVPFYAFSIPLGPGAEVTRGSGGATKEITPMVAAIPNPVTREHLAAHYIKRSWVELVEGLIDDTIAWSVSESAAIAAGADREQGEEYQG